MAGINTDPAAPAAPAAVTEETAAPDPLAPVVARQGHREARAKAVIARLKEAETDGLDASDYRTPDFAALAPSRAGGGDVKLTEAVLTFARHLPGVFPMHA
jgi:L,D-transpeptidase YcbB